MSAEFFFSYQPLVNVLKRFRSERYKFHHSGTLTLTFLFLHWQHVVSDKRVLAMVKSAAAELEDEQDEGALASDLDMELDFVSKVSELFVDLNLIFYDVERKNPPVEGNVCNIIRPVRIFFQRSQHNFELLRCNFWRWLQQKMWCQNPDIHKWFR